MTRNLFLAIFMLVFVLTGTVFANNKSSNSNTSNSNSSPGSIVVGGTTYQQQDPFDQLRDFQDEMERVFKNLMGDQLARFPRTNSRGALGSLTHSPDLAVAETDKEYIINLDLPGMSKDQIDVQIQNSILTVSGERKRVERKEEKKDGSAYSYEGRSFGTFSHSMELPENVDENKVSAEYEQGVLTISIEKKAPGPAPAPKRIKVN